MINNDQSTLLLYCCEDVKSHRSGGDTVPLIRKYFSFGRIQWGRMKKFEIVMTGRLITRELFDELNSIWGSYTVHCFSSSCHNKVDKFYSRFWNPGCAEVDAFYQSWVGENCWLVPPVNIIPSVLYTIWVYNSHKEHTMATLFSRNSRSSILYRQGMLHAR